MNDSCEEQVPYFMSNTIFPNVLTDFEISEKRAMLEKVLNYATRVALRPHYGAGVDSACNRNMY
jgi:hypothetical protein